MSHSAMSNPAPPTGSAGSAADKLREICEPRYDFGGVCFDLDDPVDRDLVCFMLSQALYGEATGVYCGKSLYAAHSLEAARFYVRQARQELNHLELFADIFRNFSITISRKISKNYVIVYLEKIDHLSLTWCGASF